jgi:multidrug efflux system membrane fusion protein
LSYKFILVVVAAVLLQSGCQGPTKAQSAGPPPPVPVTFAIATQEAVPVELHTIGTVEASAVIQVKPQVAGELTKADFVEGAMVNQGDLLFEIDKRPYIDAQRQAEAGLAKDQALLEQAGANLAHDTAQAKYADADAERYGQLAKEGIVSHSQNEQSRSNADAMRASIRADQAAMQSARAAIANDEAAIDRAKLDVGYCDVRSPIAGRAGNLLIQAGNLVKANGDNAVVVVNQVTPIWVSFAIPEQHLDAIRHNSAARRLAVEVSPRDNAAQKIRGVLSVIDNTVDTNSGTIHLKASFDNQSRVLWPGQFVDVAMVLDTQRDAILIPSEAVQAGQNGQMVYVIKPDKTVEARMVTVGQVHAGKIVVEKGIAAGESVVTDGQLRLFPGAKIQPVVASKLNS